MMTATDLPTLRTIRRARLLTQQQLATAAGMSVAGVANIEAGRSRPTLTTIRKIADVLELDPAGIAEFADTIARGRFAERPAQ